MAAHLAQRSEGARDGAREIKFAIRRIGYYERSAAASLIKLIEWQRC
jgi:hypothetical protein